MEYSTVIYKFYVIKMNGIRALVVDPSSALSDPALIIYNHWLQGHSIERAAQLLCTSELNYSTDTTNVLKHGGVTGVDDVAGSNSNNETKIVTMPESILSLYRDEVQDAYRTFQVFEALLEQPNLLGVQSQIECPVDNAAQRQQLIALYYGFDSRVLREFMGVKLTAKLRSNLDDISDKTHVSIRSVRRQFDNLRRVHSRFEEVSTFLGNNCKQISEDFCLPTSLAKRYAVASFLLYHRFDLETSDRKYQFLTWSDCEYMGIQVMAKWVTRPVLMMSRKSINEIDSMFGRSKYLTNRDNENSTNATTVPSSTDEETWTLNANVDGEVDGNRSKHSPSKMHSFQISLRSDSNNDILRSRSVPNDSHLFTHGASIKSTSTPRSFLSTQSLTSSLLHDDNDDTIHLDVPYGPSVSDISFTASIDASGSTFALNRRSSVDLAPAWLSDVRDMKTQVMGSSSTFDLLVERIVGNIVRVRSVASNSSGGGGSSGDSIVGIKKVTKEVVRNMLTIGGNLSQAKELRDFFEDVIEKVSDPLLDLFYTRSSGSGGSVIGGDTDGSGGHMKKMVHGDNLGTRGNEGWVGKVASMPMKVDTSVADDTKVFFCAVFDASCDSIKLLTPIKRRERLLSSWRRFLDVIGCCTLRMMRRQLKSMR